MSTIVHFDISAENTERARLFYEELFGWKFHKLPMDYYMISTKALDGTEGVGGGLSLRDTAASSARPVGIINYIGVSSLSKSLKKVTALGGKVLTEVQPVAGYGMLAVCTDAEGNVFGMFEEEDN